MKLRKRDPSVKWTRTFFGRPFWNVGEVKRALARVPGYRERDLDVDLGIPPRYEGDGETTPYTPATIWNALPVAFALSKSFGTRLDANRKLRSQLDRERPLWRRDSRAIVDDAAFLGRYRQLLELQHDIETAYFDTIYTSSNARLELKGTLRKVSNEVEANGGRPLDFTVLVGGLRDLSHLRPMIDLHETAGALVNRNAPVADDTAIAFANRWFHRGRRELDLAIPRWPDDLAFVREMLEHACATWRPENDPRVVVNEQHEKARAEIARALDALRGRPLLRLAFWKKLSRVRRFAWWREEMRDVSTQAYALVRAWTLDAASRLVTRGHLGAVDDVWSLRSEHVLDALSGLASPQLTRARAREGTRVMQSFAKFNPPGEIGRRHERPVASTNAPTTGALSGTACSAGRAEGTVRIARTIDDARSIKDGEVLVAVFTDPGWTPLFSRLSAVVTETGGLLSHAAVIAREVGIPAVLAVNGATSTLRDGDRVVVDGTLGTVERL